MASNGKRMVKEDLIKKLERISENPTYELLNFKNDDSNIDFGYINERDPYQFGATLDRYNAFTLREHYSGSGYEESFFVVSVPNADALYPNTFQHFYTALGAKVGDTTVYADNKGIITIPSGGSGSGPTVTRYTGYASHPITYTISSSASTSDYAFINIFSSELSGFLNYDNVNPGDILYINVTLDDKTSTLFTVCVPPKPNVSGGVASSDTYNGVRDEADMYWWNCTTNNHMTNQQETTESNIVQKGFFPTANAIINIYMPEYPYRGDGVHSTTITINSITHIAF